MPDDWDRLTAYTTRHHGIISLGAARELGVADQSIRVFLRAGRLVRRARATYAVAGSPRSWNQQVMVATVSSAGWASHRTAAALWALDGFRPGLVEVLTLKGRSRDRRWRTHETCRLADVDIREVDRIPCTAIPRTILDLAAVAHPRQVEMALDSACRRWPGMVDLVAQRFLELQTSGRRGTPLLRGLLEERLGTGRFTQSGFETMTLRLVRSVGLPEPIPQFKVVDGDFKAYIDLAWPLLMLGLECDSLAWHSGKQAHEGDRRRRRKLKALGWDMIEVTYDDVTKRRAETGEQIRTLYHARKDQLAL